MSAIEDKRGELSRSGSIVRRGGVKPLFQDGLTVVIKDTDDRGYLLRNYVNGESTTIRLTPPFVIILEAIAINPDGELESMLNRLGSQFDSVYPDSGKRLVERLRHHHIDTIDSFPETNGDIRHRLKPNTPFIVRYIKGKPTSIVEQPQTAVQELPPAIESPTEARISVQNIVGSRPSDRPLIERPEMVVFNPDPKLEALAVPVLEFQNELYNYILTRVGNEADALDLTQRTLIGATDRLRKGRYIEQGKLNSWLFSIAKNNWRNEMRRRGRVFWGSLEDVLDPSFSIESTIPEVVVARREEIEKVRKALEEISERYREVLLLKEDEELSMKEIGVRLGITEAAAKILVFRARNALRDAYIKLDAA